MNLKPLLKALIALTLLGTAVSVYAQSDAVLKTVNGSKIVSSQLNDMVTLAVANGAKDTPELRQNLLDDLVVREVMAQDIKKTGLLKKDNNALKLKLAQENSLLELWFADYFKKIR